MIGGEAHTQTFVSDLGGVSLRQVRQAISPERYERSTPRALLGLSFDLGLYVLALVGVFMAGWPAQILFSIVAGGAVAFLFVWGHDACHGALFKSRGVSEAFGTVAMLPSLHMYRLWAFGHNKVHHGFTSLSSVDWTWRPLSPAQYHSASRARRVVYRLERHPLTCPVHYLLRVWWPGMITFRPDPRAKRMRGFRKSQIGMALFVVLLSIFAYRDAGGWLGVVMVVVVPFLVFTYLISLFVYLQHTHPKVPFFGSRREWNATVGQVRCSTVVRCSRLSEWLTHSILVHTPHHVDTRIPYYNLGAAYTDL